MMFKSIVINEDQLVVCITQILGQDNEVRKQNEAALQQYRDTYPNEFITSFLSLCRNQELRIRQFSSVHLRNCLSNFTPKSFKNIWSMLNQQTQELVKNDLFVLLNQETNSNVRNQLADAIGEIG